MTINNALIKIVFDTNKKKYRATPINGGGWIRFPRKLRVPNAVYQVEELREGKAGSWMACGKIEAI